MTSSQQLQIYFFEIQDNIQNHFIAAISKEQAAQIFIRKIQPSEDLEVEFLTHSGLQGLAEGSIPPKRVNDLRLEELKISNPGYITKDLIVANLTRPLDQTMSSHGSKTSKTPPS